MGIVRGRWFSRRLLPVGLATLLMALIPIQLRALVHSDPPQFRFPAAKTIVHRGLSNPFAGDLNADGHLDIVAEKSGGLVVLVGPGLSVATAEFASMTPVAVGDADADGDLDVIALTRSTQPNDGQCERGSGTIIVTLRNDGQGRFSPLRCRLSSEMRPVGFGDIDGDRQLDALLASSRWPVEPWIVGAAHGLGDGRFGSPQAISGPSREALPAYATVLADMDGDGHADLVALTTSKVPAIYHNLGDGRFGEPPSRQGATIPVESFALVELDGDERPDVVGRSPDGARLAVFWNRAGALAPGPVLSTGLQSSATVSDIVAGGDLNGDGDVDLLFRTAPVSEDRQPPGADETRVWLQAGGGFSGPRTLAERSIRPILLLDLDGDAMADVVGPGEIVLSRRA